jgi:hypothetical protein
MIPQFHLYRMWKHPTACRAALYRAPEIHTTLLAEVTTSEPHHNTAQKAMTNLHPQSFFPTLATMSCPLASGIAIRQHMSSAHSAVREDKRSHLGTASSVCLLYVRAASRLIKSKLSAHNSPALHCILYNLHGLIILYYNILKFTVEELVLSLKQYYDIPTYGEPILQPTNLL